MFIKIIIFIAMFVIILSLASGLIFLVRDGGKSNRTIKALSWRIGLSLALFVFLLVAFGLGLIKPHSI